MNLRNLFILLLWSITTIVVASQKADDPHNRITALEKEVSMVNDNIAALRAFLDKSAIMVGVAPNDKGYAIELSDGTCLNVTFGAQVASLVPIMGIDKDGYWIYSLNQGVIYQQLLVDGKPISAYPVIGRQTSSNAESVTPKLKIDTAGYWLISLDKGLTWVNLFVDGKKVSSKGKGTPLEYSGFFKSLNYSKATSILSVELLDGTKLELKVEDTFYLKIAAQSNERFYLNDRRSFFVEQAGINKFFIKAPDGWMVTFKEDILTVTSPTSAAAPETAVEIVIVVISEKNHLKTSTLNIQFINAQREADACVAWQKFKAGAADNVLLDFSYAGYKHGEVAPPESETLGYTVYNMVDRGADPTGNTSSRVVLISLLEQLKLTGKTGNHNNANPNARVVIYFPEGRYILHNDDDNTVDPLSPNQQYKDSKGNNRSETILINGGNYVIKGAGRDKTTIVMATPNLPRHPTNMWTSPVMINLQNWQGLADLTYVTSDAAKGSFAVDVASTSGMSVGDWVCLSLSNNDPELVAQELAPRTVDNPQMTNIQTISVVDYHQIRSISGKRITFCEPIMHIVEAKWGWKIRKYRHYENVGVEDIAFEGNAKADFKHHSSWEDDGAYKPIGMGRLTNSWMRRVDFRNVSEAMSIVNSANCSAYDITISGNRGHSSIRSQASSRVFLGKIIDHSKSQTNNNAGQFHAVGVSVTSMGAVIWNNTWGDDSMFESHSSQPRATLVDCCTGGFVQDRFGGDLAAVPCHLDDLTIWNLNATTTHVDASNNPFKWWISSSKYRKTMPPTIVGYHGAPMVFDTARDQVKYLESNGSKVQPKSLYEEQMRERLGYVPAWLNSLK